MSTTRIYNIDGIFYDKSITMEQLRTKPTQLIDWLASGETVVLRRYQTVLGLITPIDNEM